METTYAVIKDDICTIRVGMIVEVSIDDVNCESEYIRLGENNFCDAMRRDCLTLIDEEEYKFLKPKSDFIKAFVEKNDEPTVIRIHWDFTDGTELSYQEALACIGSFTTNCLEFFSSDYPNSVIVRKNGSSISVKDLLTGKGNHTMKEIRKTHNLRKMLVAGSFNW